MSTLYPEEVAITWIEPDAKNWPFLREGTREYPTLHGVPRRKYWDGRRLVAIADLRPGTEKNAVGYVSRRHWYIEERDFTVDAKNHPYGAPSESVWTHSIRAGRDSVRVNPAAAKPASQGS